MIGISLYQRTEPEFIEVQGWELVNATTKCKAHKGIARLYVSTAQNFVECKDSTVTTMDVNP